MQLTYDSLLDFHIDSLRRRRPDIPQLHIINIAHKADLCREQKISKNPLCVGISKNSNLVYNTLDGIEVVWDVDSPNNMIRVVY